MHDGRFRPVYVPGGVVTGRWASSGGGALQLPRQLREAVRADPGWLLVVADVAQLEPRVLAAMAGDVALADAARGRDLYAGVVDSGAVATRQEAKIAMLGAMYGATTGESGRLVPRLRRTYPAGDGDSSTRRRGPARTAESSRPGSGRTSPAAVGGLVRGAVAGDRGRGVRRGRDPGPPLGARPRPVHAQLRRAGHGRGVGARLDGRICARGWPRCRRWRIRMPRPAPAPSSGAQPHLAFFLHDEVIVHAPAAHAEAAAAAVRDAAAAAAARLLFGDFPIDFPLDLRIAESALKD